MNLCVKIRETSIEAERISKYRNSDFSRVGANRGAASHIETREDNLLSTVFATAPILALYPLYIVAMNALLCVSEKTNRFVSGANLLIHICAVYSFVQNGAELEELLALFLFSVAVSLIFGDVFQKRRAKRLRCAKAGEDGKE